MTWVTSFKKGVQADKSNRTLQYKLNRFLLAYRSAPHAVTELSPAQLLLGRNVKTRLDLIKSNITALFVGWTNNHGRCTSDGLKTVRSCKLPEGFRCELWTIVRHNLVRESHAGKQRAQRVNGFFSSSVLHHKKISGHMLWASITAMSIFPWTGPAKVMWSLAREGKGTPTDVGVHELNYLLTSDIPHSFGPPLLCPCRCLATKRTPGTNTLSWPYQCDPREMENLTVKCIWYRRVYQFFSSNYRNFCRFERLSQFINWW